MSKFVLGETVTDEKGRLAIVRAVYISKEGQQCYALELNGTVNFVEQVKLKKAQAPDLAA